MAEDSKDRAGVALALGGTGAALGVTALIAALTRKAEAAPPGEIPPITVVLDEETRRALATILSQQAATLDAIITANRTLTDILEALGEVPVERRILAPFKAENETLEKGVPFSIYEDAVGKGALIWAIFDVSDPDTKLSIRIDGLVWTFKFSTLLTQGIQQPLFPGAWLSKADALTGHYCIVFSAGNLTGFTYEQRLIISITYEGAGTATLHEARGIKWSYLS